MVQLLGFQITRQTDDREKPAEAKQAFTVPSPDDGTTTISAGGYFGQYLDMEVTAKNDIDLIKRYREIAQHPECDIRFVFANAKNKLYKSSKTTYGDWCNRHGFDWAEKTVPREWLKNE